MSRDVKKFTKKRFIFNIGVDLHREFFGQYNGDVRLELNGLDHQKVYDFLLNSTDDECAPVVMETLHRIYDLASPEGADLIKNEADQKNRVIGDGDDLSVEELAFTAYLKHKEIFDRAHDLYICHNVKSPAEYVGAEEKPLKNTPARIEAFRKSISGFFNERYKGKYCDIRIYPDADEVNIVILHGKHLKSGTFIIDEQPQPTRYRDMKEDIVTFASVDGRLKVTAATEAERDEIARRFGQCFFGDEEFFMWKDSQNLYTLEPLAKNGTDFRFNHEWDPETLDVRITEMQVLMSAAGRRKRNICSITIKDPDCLSRLANHRSIDITKRDINYAIIKFTFQPNGGRRKTVPVKLKPPCLCHFERRYFENRIMEHLKRNGFAVERKPVVARP
jgi:hypothetical protein